MCTCASIRIVVCLACRPYLLWLVAPLCPGSQELELRQKLPLLGDVVFGASLQAPSVQQGAGPASQNLHDREQCMVRQDVLMKQEATICE